jgi:hypothetical protein
MWPVVSVDVPSGDNVNQYNANRGRRDDRSVSTQYLKDHETSSWVIARLTVGIRFWVDVELWKLKVRN